MRRIYFIFAFLTGVLFAAACQDNSNQEPEETQKEPTKGIVPQLKNMTFRKGDNIELSNSEYHQGGVITSTFELPEGMVVEIFNEGDNKGGIKFKTENFELSSVTGNTVSGTVALPLFFGFGNEIIIPMEFHPDEAGESFKGKSVYEGNGMRLAVSADIATDKTVLDYSLGVKQYFTDFHKDIVAVGNDGGEDDWVSLVTGFVLDLPERGESYKYDKSPILIDWISESYPVDFVEGMCPNDFLQLVLNTPFLNEDDYGFERGGHDLISISDLLGRLGSVMKFEIGFNSLVTSRFSIAPLCKDISTGNMVVSAHPYSPYYLPSSYSSGSPFSFSDITESNFKLYIDPQRLFDVRIPKELIKAENVDPWLWAEFLYYSSGTASMYAFLSNIILALSPDNATGIPMKYNLSGPHVDNGLSHFSVSFRNMETSIRMLKGIILPLLNDEGNKKRLIDALEDDSRTSAYVPELIFLIERLVDLFDASTHVEFGFIYSFVNEEYAQHDLMEKKYNSLYQ